MPFSLLLPPFPKRPQPASPSSSLRGGFSGPHHERWFDFDYLTWSIPESIFEAFAASKPPKDLAFPKANPYVPTRFDPVPLDPEDDYRAGGGEGKGEGEEGEEKGKEEGKGKEEEKGKEEGEEEGKGGVPLRAPRLPPPAATPTLLLSAPHLRVWHSRDRQFAQPRACAYLRLSSASLYASARSCASTHLALKLFEDALSEELYCADLGGLTCNAWFEGLGGWDVRFDGFYDKLGHLVRSSFAKGLAAVTDRAMGQAEEEGEEGGGPGGDPATSPARSRGSPWAITRSSFLRVREALERRYRNANHDAGTFATYLRLRALRAPSFDAEAVADELRTLGPAEVAAALRRGLAAGDAFLECLFHGDVARSEAIDVAQSVLEQIARNAGVRSGGGADEARLPAWPFSGRAPPEACVLLGVEREQGERVAQEKSAANGTENIAHFTDPTLAPSSGALAAPAPSSCALAAPAPSSLPTPAPAPSSLPTPAPAPSLLPTGVRDSARPPFRRPVSLVHRSLARSGSGRNSVAEVYLQIGPDSDRLRALVDLLEQVAGEPIYDTLRTKEQLGYAVHSGTRLTHGALGFAVVVVSASRGPRYLDARIERFLRAFRATLVDMPEETLEAHKSSLVAAKRRKDRSVADEADRAWEHVVARTCRFDAREREAQIVLEASKNDLLELYDTYIYPGEEEEEEKEEDEGGQEPSAPPKGRGSRGERGHAPAQGSAPAPPKAPPKAPSKAPFPSRRAKLAIHVISHARKEEMTAPLLPGEEEVADLDELKRRFRLHTVRDPTLVQGTTAGLARA